MTGWPKAARPVAFDMVLDLVMPRLFGDVTAPEIKIELIFFLSNLSIQIFKFEPCWEDEVLEVTAVAVAGLEPLYRGVFSLIVAVSTVFCRLKFDWTLLFTLGAAEGGGPKIKIIIRPKVEVYQRLRKAVMTIACKG